MTADEYYRPPLRPCPAGDACVNGYTTARTWLSGMTSLLLLVGDAAQNTNRSVHPYLDAVPVYSARRPSPDAIELTAGLAGRPPREFGHDGSDRIQATDAIIRAAGLDPATWGVCPSCHGHAHHPDDPCDCEE